QWRKPVDAVGHLHHCDGVNWHVSALDGAQIRAQSPCRFTAEACHCRCRICCNISAVGLAATIKLRRLAGFGTKNQHPGYAHCGWKSLSPAQPATPVQLSVEHNRATVRRHVEGAVQMCG